MNQIINRRDTIIFLYGVGGALLVTGGAIFIYDWATVEDIVEVPPASGLVEYTDGVYQARASYTVPVGDEHVDVRMTIKENEIVEVESTHSEDNPRSQRHQRDFDESYKADLVGRPLETVSLSRVSGASYTTLAFMEAVEDIREQAEVK